MDPAGIREFRNLIRQLAGEGMSVFISSHLLSEIQMMCDRVAILNNGRLLKEAAVSHLVEPSNAVAFRVENPTHALSVFRREGVVAKEHEPGIIHAQLKEKAVPYIIKQLASQGVSIYEVRSEQNSLEDMFLQLTEQTTSDSPGGGKINA